MEYKRKIRATNNTFLCRIKNETSQPSRWSTSTDAPSSGGRGDAQPENKGSVPTRLDERILPLQERRCPEARDLGWTNGCCSNSMITFNDNRQ